MDPRALPPGHRMGIRPRQTLQATQHGRRIHRTHLPRHPLPQPHRSRRQTNHKEGRIMSTRTYCEWCEEPLSPSHTGPCPKCGKTGKKCEVSASEIVTLRSSYSLEVRREFFDENPRIKWLINILGLGSTFMGYFLQREIGIFFGLFIWFILWLLGPYSIIKVIEITRTRGD